MTDNLFEAARHGLEATDPDQKLRYTRALAVAWSAGRLTPSGGTPPQPIDQAGRPARPLLVHPRRLPRRTLAHPQGRAALIHAVAHIEFNAINLALDAVYRFRDMPAAFYDDWIRVAREEAHHFGLMRGRLQTQGYDYGDFPGHDGLWDMARRTADDPLVRMALVPRVMEARGLDVTPGMIERFHTTGDNETADCLTIILRDEVEHVQAGSRWFSYLCRQRGQEPEATYFQLLEEHMSGQVRCPLNREARRCAGFAESELERLEALCTR